MVNWCCQTVKSPGFDWSRGIMVGCRKLAVVSDLKLITLPFAQSAVEPLIWNRAESKKLTYYPDAPKI